jgi:pimeloyl-ACP methyl ester carboxylesterase
MAPASENAQVLVPDQRRHGHSDLSEPSRWPLDTWADDLAALVDVLGLSRPVVLGTSFGGFVVQRYLARHPDQPAGAVLVSTIPRAPGEAETVERFRQLGGEPAAAAMQRSFREHTVELSASGRRSARRSWFVAS